jgi:hypothetical protein
MELRYNLTLIKKEPYHWPFAAIPQGFLVCPISGIFTNAATNLGLLLCCNGEFTELIGCCRS